MLGSAIAHEVCRNVRLAKVDQPVAAVNTKMTMVMVNNNCVNHDDDGDGELQWCQSCMMTVMLVIMLDWPRLTDNIV